ncbi:MAG: ATP-binding protein [Bacteroidetes bacterium]|nr:ATP-binding protein [Bacteroidota bacterium]
MSSDFILDRGSAEYFHGRKEIIDTFNSALKVFRKKKNGTTFMIQGAPGAGKTALLDVLSKHAKKRGWKTAHIYPNVLWNPHELLPLLRKRSGHQVTGLGAGGGVGNVGTANLSIGVRPPTHTIIKLLRKQRKPLLLILDEAQALGLKDVVPPEMKGVVTSVLKQIHNGDLGKPVMLLAGGLGTTEAALSTFGISRSMRKCRVLLGCLSKESTCAVIRDFLIHEGGVSKPPLEWIEAIEERTHRWPQHIISYADPAVKYLASHQTLKDEGLNMVLQQGRAEQIEYYKVRVKGIDRKKRQVLAKIFADVPLGETMEFEDIMAVLENEYPPEVAEALFNKALERGIIDEREDEDYGIPIPSFHSWLVDEYANGKD